MAITSANVTARIEPEIKDKVAIRLLRASEMAQEKTVSVSAFPHCRYLSVISDIDLQ